MPTPNFNRPDNIHTALQFNSVTDLPELRVNIGGSTIEITGPVTVPAEVEISNTLANPVPVTGTVTANQGTSPWVVSGNVNATLSGTPTVNIGTIPEVEIKNDSGNPVPVTGTVTANQGTSPWVVSGTVATTIGGTNTDAFGRLRVSQPYTLFDTQSRYYDHGQFSSAISTGGSVQYVENESSFQLNVTSAAGSSVVRETMRVFPYQPGKSLLILNTFCMNTPKVNLRQRVGFFGATNGVFFENDGVYNYFVIRSESTGVEERVRQDLWNGNQLTGQLFVDRTQIQWADVEWLGVGSVRVGFVIDGAFIVCHTFNHANQIGNNKVYMTTATLPIRYEITNTGATTGASMMTQICSTVISEGGYNSLGTTESAGTGITPKRLNTGGVLYPIASIRLDSSRLDSIVVPSQLDFLSTTVNYYRWVLLKNATLTGATWAGSSSSGSVNYDTGATSVSGGVQLESGFVSSRETTGLSANGIFQFQLGRTLAGVSDVVTLCMVATSNNADVLAQLGWQELT